MAFVANAKLQPYSDFNSMDDNMDISSDVGHRNMGDDDDIDIDIDLHPDRGDGNANDDFMADNSHHNPDDDLMFDENAGHDDNPLENMEQDNAGQQYDQLQDVQDQYPPQTSAPQQPAFDLAPNPTFDHSAQHPPTVNPKPATFHYPPNQDHNQFYPQFEQGSHPDPHFQGHQPPFQYPPQDYVGQYPSEASRPLMAGSVEPSGVGYDQSGEYSQQVSHEASSQANGYGLPNTATDAQGPETADNADPSQVQGGEHDDALQAEDDSQAAPVLHPVVVNWKGDHFSLFPGMDEDPYEGYFLEDTTPAFSDVSSLMGSLRQVLGEDCPVSAELRLAFPALGLTLTQNSSSKTPVSLVDIIEVYFSLCQNDGNDYPDPLEAILSTRQDPEIRIAELRQALAEGKGLSQVVAETWNAEDSDNSFDDESPDYADVAGHANGDDETTHELDEYKEVYEDISAVVKELKTLAPEVEVPPETSDAQGSASSDNDEVDIEQQESEAAQDIGQSSEEQQPAQEKNIDEHDDLLDDPGDEEPGEQAKVDKSDESQFKSQSTSDPVNQEQLAADNPVSDGKDTSNTSASKNETATAENDDSLSHNDALEDLTEAAEAPHEEVGIEEDYLETHTDQPTEPNEPTQDGLDLLEDTEDPVGDQNDADDLLEDHEDETALEETTFDAELDRTDLEADQIDDFENSIDSSVPVSAVGKGIESTDVTEPSLADSATPSNKRPREELGPDELEPDADTSDVKRHRSD